LSGSSSLFGIALASGHLVLWNYFRNCCGIVVGYLSTSQLSVSGPAAGLTAIILTAISDLGAFNILLLAVFYRGIS
jgi:MFS superfamily sulfate permease-like transporter